MITSIILRELDEDRFSFKKFWGRRVRRIFPALMTMLIVTSVAARFILFRGDWPSVAIQGAAATLSTANIVFWKMSGDYWGPVANESPFLHTWSLSVEEQFYLVYPLILVLLMKFARRRLVTAIVLIAVSSFALYLVGSIYKPFSTFYLLPTRAWELACGSFLAAWHRTPRGTVPQAVSRALSLSGLVAVIASFFVFSARHSFDGYLAIPVIGTVLVIEFSGSGGLAAKILAHRAAVFIGKISYSLYLWHWPVIVLGRRLFNSMGREPDVPLLLGVIVLASLLSYRFVEVPTRHASFRSPAFRLTLASFVASLSLSLLLYIQPDSYDVSMFTRPVSKANFYSVRPRDSSDERSAWIEARPSESRASEAYSTGGIIKQYGGSTPEVVVLGDSHALMWASTIDRAAQELGVTISFYAAFATSPFIEIPVRKEPASTYFTSEEKYVYDKSRLEYLAKWKPKVVIIASRWASPFVDYGDHLPKDLFKYLGDLGCKVILINQPPELPFNRKDIRQCLAYLNIYPEAGEKKYTQAARSASIAKSTDLVRDACQTYPFCSSIETADIYRSADGQVWVLDGLQLIYIDDDHLSEYGAQQAEGRIRDALGAALSAPKKTP